MLLSVVATTQLALVAWGGLSRWRGGGMGMYSEIHPGRTELWAVSSGDGVEVGAIEVGAIEVGAIEVGAPDGWRPGCPWSARARRCERWPTADCLTTLAECLQPDSPYTRIEAWRPAFSAGERVWTLRQVASGER